MKKVLGLIVAGLAGFIGFAANVPFKFSGINLQGIDSPQGMQSASNCVRTQSCINAPRKG